MRYNVDEFAMLGQQFSFSYDNYSDDFSFNSLNDIISERLDIAFDTYGISEPDVVLIQVLYRVVFYGELEKLKIVGLKRVISNNEYTKIRKVSPYFPLSFDLVDYGKPLKVVISNNIVQNVLTLKKGNSVDYIDFIEFFYKNNSLLPDKIKANPFHSGQLFFQRTVKGVDIILAIDIINPCKYIKKAYTITGVFLFLGVVEDTSIGNNVIERKFGNYTFFIKDNGIIFSEKKMFYLL